MGGGGCGRGVSNLGTARCGRMMKCVHVDDFVLKQRAL